jgi:hypothetical protein
MDERSSSSLAMRGLTRSIDDLRKEAAKCILLCANCHAKVEWGSAPILHPTLKDGSTARDKLDEAA